MSDHDILARADEREPELEPYLKRTRFEYAERNGHVFLVIHTHLGLSGFYQCVERHRLWGGPPILRVAREDTMTAEAFAALTAGCYETMIEAERAAGLV